MSLTVKQCAQYVEHTLGGELGAPMSIRTLVNMAGEWLYTTQTWRFNVRRHAIITPRTKIDITGASWTSATKTINKTGAFAGYDFVDGDYIKVTAGTGAATGEYEIASNPDDDNIVLVSSFGADNSDTAGTMPNNTVALPADLREIHAIDTDGSASEGFAWVGHERFAYGRTGRWSFTAFRMRGTIIGIAPQAGGEVSYYIEVDPERTADDPLYVRYSVGWKAVTSDIDVLPLPDDGRLDMLFIQTLIEHARGMDKEDEIPLPQRLDAFRASNYFRSHAKRDGVMQPHLGPLRGSRTTRRRSGGGRWYARLES